MMDIAALILVLLIWFSMPLLAVLLLVIPFVIWMYYYIQLAKQRDRLRRIDILPVAWAIGMPAYFIVLFYYNGPISGAMSVANEPMLGWSAVLVWAPTILGILCVVLAIPTQRRALVTWFGVGAVLVQVSMVVLFTVSNDFQHTYWGFVGMPLPVWLFFFPSSYGLILCAESEQRRPRAVCRYCDYPFGTLDNLACSECGNAADPMASSTPTTESTS